MNGNQLLRMVMRMVMNRGVNAGIRHFANRGQNPHDMTSEERNQAKATGQNLKSARQGMRIARRFMR